MKIAIDFSVNTAGGDAVGSIDGQIELGNEPLIGDTIYFSSAPDGRVIPNGHRYAGLLKVQERIIRPNHEGGLIALSLQDLTVENREQALAVMQYFEISYGLFSTVYE
jgi:hypothetical protein